MSAETVAALIDAASRHFRPQPTLEVTLEANPTSVERERLLGFRAAGVNRLSLGVQALDDVALAVLGRTHSSGEAMAALEYARSTFSRLSFDLIYARPGQSLGAWRRELERALALAADHLSLYQLTIEPGTAFEALHRRGDLVLPQDWLATALYDATSEAASRYGLRAYEISNYAKPGAESRHNLTYWRYGDYAGIGPGAHGRLSLDGRLVATRRHRAPEPWAARVEAYGHGSTPEEIVTSRAKAREMLIMGLRLSEGVDSGKFGARTGMSLESAVDREVLLRAEDAGYVELANGRLRATPAGMQRLDALLPELLL
jgi:oxygen-independent coproporphyrinogen-3 oxidase